MDGVAKKYDQVQHLHQARNGVDLIDRLGLGRGNVVLDLGCGTGYLSSVLAERVGREGRVVGVDPNTDRLEIAKRNFSQIDNLHFVAGSSENFPSGPYDVVFANHVMHWIKEKESTFRVVYENLKHGGKFAFLCQAESSSTIFELLGPSTCDLHYCSCEAYKSLALKCGFQVDYQSVEPEQYSFENVDKCIEWVLATLNVDPATVDPVAMAEAKERFSSKPNIDWPWMKLVLVLKRA